MGVAVFEPGDGERAHDDLLAGGDTDDFFFGEEDFHTIGGASGDVGQFFACGDGHSGAAFLHKSDRAILGSADEAALDQGGGVVPLDLPPAHDSVCGSGFSLGFGDDLLAVAMAEDIELFLDFLHFTSGDLALCEGAVVVLTTRPACPG